MSVPSCAQTSTAYRLGGWPRTACTPADATSMSFRLPVKRRKSPSAIGLRQILPVQTKRTFFTIGTRSERVYQTKSEPVQVNFHGKRARFINYLWLLVAAHCGYCEHRSIALQQMNVETLRHVPLFES